MRIAVEHVLGMLAAGDTPETILHEYPTLEPEDIRSELPARSRMRSIEVGARIRPATTPWGDVKFLRQTPAPGRDAFKGR